jgi:hypothetical protein
MRLTKVLVLIIGLYATLSLGDEAYDQCVQDTKEVIGAKYTFQTYGEFVNHLYDICVQDKACSQSYFQHNHKNFTTFKFLIGPLIGRYSQNVGSIYFDGVETLAYMLCDRDDWMKTGSVQISNIKSFSNDGKVSFIANEAIDHMFKTSTLYQMYSQVSASRPNCGLNQKLIVSQDGSMVSCVCQENQNCATSMHNAVYTDVTLALVIVFQVLLLGVNSFEAAFRIRIWQTLKRPSKKDPDSVLRMIGQY